MTTESIPGRANICPVRDDQYLVCIVTVTNCMVVHGYDQVVKLHNKQARQST